MDGSGRSVAWYARLLGVQEVVSSNLTAPTILIIETIGDSAASPNSPTEILRTFTKNGKGSILICSGVFEPSECVE